MYVRGLEMHYLFEFPLSFLRYQIKVTVNCSVNPESKFIYALLAHMRCQNGEKKYNKGFPDASTQFSFTFHKLKFQDLILFPFQ